MTALVALVLAAAVTRGEAPPPPKITVPGCTSPAPGAPPFGPGEKLEFEIDSMGVRIATFSLTAGRERGEAPWVVRARAKTSSLAANFRSVDSKVEVRLDESLASRSYSEDGIEAGKHGSVDVTFPPQGKLKVRVTRQGNRVDAQLSAPDDVRDLIGALYAARAMPLEVGSELCLPIFGNRQVWILRAKTVERESIDTPAGTFDTLHLEATATRFGTPGTSREVHLWFTDDDRRLPVAAFGEVQNKPVRAQLVGFEAGRKVAKARAVPARPSR